MIINIFSIFDPSTSQTLSLNWFRIILLFIFLPYQFWLIPSRYSYIYFKSINYLYREFKTLISFSYSNLIIFISLLFTIFFNNFLGLFPFIFTASRHLRFSLTLSLSFWIRIITFRTLNYINDLLAHLTPQGTPLILIPFIVIIESISLLIRPFTLAIRLSANIIAGHLLLSLLGRSGQLINSIPIILIILSTQILLFILEISVAIIQSYVFTILSTLYRREA